MDRLAIDTTTETVQPATVLARTVASSGRATRVVVDLDAIAGNVRYFRELVTPGTAVMAVVKADGYGHGAVAVAREALAAGASQLGVATVDEGVALRAAGVPAPILVLGPVDMSEIEAALAHELSLSVADRRFLDAVEATASARGFARVPMHLKVDTGMHRFGAAPEDALELAGALARSDRLRFAGFFTHFADADGADEAPTACQAAILDAVTGRLVERGIRPGLIHAANSAAALRWRRFDYDLVRIGIATYGLPPAAGFAMPERLRPALRVVSRVARVAPIRAGDGVSYGLSYRAARDEWVALVPIGYADGYPRALSNVGWMGVAGRRLPVRGRVCMDQTVVGVDDPVRIEVGDDIAVIGGDGPSLEEVATATGTIAYEIATGLSRRMPRHYVRSGTPRVH